MKSLEDFPRKADPNKDPLHIVYSEVTFSELKTFDLMRLLHSYRKNNQRSLQLWQQSLDGLSIEQIEEFCPNEHDKEFFKTIKKGERIPESKYLKALKKELNTREHLTPHEKRSIRKCS